MSHILKTHMAKWLAGIVDSGLFIKDTIHYYLVVIAMDYATETSFKHYEPHFQDTYGQMVGWNRRQWALEREIICCFRLNCCTTAIQEKTQFEAS